MGAISSLEMYELRIGPFKREQAAEWVKTCLEIAIEKHGGPVVLVVDNAPCHSHKLNQFLRKKGFLVVIFCGLVHIAPCLIRSRTSGRLSRVGL